jgi:hypothetical protein
LRMSAGALDIVLPTEDRRPRRDFARSAAQGVAVLIVMHLAIAVVTYNCLVRVAPVKTTRAARLPAPGPDHYADRRT